MRHVLTVIALLMLISGCDETITTNTSETIKVTFEQRHSDFVFAGLPVKFYLLSKQPDVFSGGALTWNTFVPDAAQWGFGDGKASTEIFPEHVFDFSGKYKVNIQHSKNAINGYQDTTLNVAPRLSLIGSKKTSENGKFLLKYPGTGYSVIHTRNRGLSTEDWMLLTTSPGFDSLRSFPLLVGTYDNIAVARVNKNGNIVLVNNSVQEISRSGGLLKSKVVSNQWTPTYLLEIEGGYVVAGYTSFSGKMNTARLTTDFDVVSTVEFNLTRNGYTLNSFNLESADVIRAHYQSANGSTLTLTKMNMRGEIISEKTVNINASASRSFKLSSGYLLAGYTTQDYAYAASQFSFTKISEEGGVEWTIKSQVENSYAQYVHSGAMEVIEMNGFVYIFFDNQKGMKVNLASGQVAWSKRFGISNDTFDAATVSESGNIVLLSAHQFDYKKFEFTTDYTLRDLCFTEIDVNGNIVLK